MLLDGLLQRGSLPVLEQVMAFTEARHQVLADNISNIDTVGYTMKDLPVEEFYQALDRAIERRDRAGASAPLAPQDTRNLRWDAGGRLRARSVAAANQNILFQDQNNRSVENQMSQMAQNGLLHNVAAELLRQQYNLLQTAISGRL
ncbi:MAG: flagellar basal body rod protein FlgB [Sedimentisphaerales bacterium]|nr:flagellar basal body rod protein FlgB [Sedimentisphaerales bacterium]